MGNSSTVVVSTDKTATDEAIIVGDGGSLQTGGLDLTGPGNHTVITNTTDAEAINRAFNFGDKVTENIAALVVSQSNAFEKLLGRIADSEDADAQTFADVLKQLGTVTDDSLARITELSESKQTEGESDRNKIILWVTLGLFAFLGVIFWKRN